MSDRPTFKWKEQEVRAAGMLFFVNGENNVKLFLMRKPSKQWENTYWEDLGGKTDNRDHSYEETAIREVVEECNNSVFSNEDTFDTCCEKIRMLLQHKPYEMFYCPKSKYLYKLNTYIKKTVNLNSFTPSSPRDPQCWVGIASRHIRLQRVIDKYITHFTHFEQF